MTSTATLAIAATGASAAITFGLVSVVCAASSRPDLGGPVLVEPLSDASEEFRTPETAGLEPPTLDSLAPQSTPGPSASPDPRTAVPPADPASPNTVKTADDDDETDDDEGGDD